ncbi:MAG: type II toxin-antitoxin system HicA family toxin [Verrucomicrobia bacterium]|nr:type II toxin-antitoxin system HicA family toxin [Verrucomicrobiota bacterium]MBS0637090.1 type II toxin-antitoxin system HicA family toxin [Verrucomicrobiota bacterium]
MKKRDIEKKMAELGWWFDHHGGEHDRWTNGIDMESVPRHREVNEMLAKKILRNVKNNPPKKEKK